MRSSNAIVRRTATTVTFVLALTGLSHAAVATEFTFASLGLDGVAHGINDSGAIVGTFGVLVEGVVTPLDVPQTVPRSTIGFGINEGGDVVGSFVADPRRPFPQGFLYRDGVYKRFTFEQAVEVLGINNDGYMVGRSCCKRGGSPEGFIIDPTGGLQFINVPDSPWDWASGINASGEIVGTFVITTFPSFTTAAYLYSDGVFMPFEVPGARRTDANGINDEGEIVGSYEDDSGTHGFFRDTDGTLTPLDFPGATGTSANGINNDGDVVGWYTDAAGVHAFLATPCESAHVHRRHFGRHCGDSCRTPESAAVGRERKKQGHKDCPNLKRDSRRLS